MMRSMPLPFPPEPASSAGIGLTRWSLARAVANAGRRNAWLRALDRTGLGFDSYDQSPIAPPALPCDSQHRGQWGVGF
jgi:hypothetical protein